MRVPRFLRSLQWMKGLRRGSFSTKPSAAINNPPAKDEQGQCERQIPPEGRQEQAHDNAQHGEEQPEDLFFHLQENISLIDTDNTDLKLKTKNLETQRNRELRRNKKLYH